MPEIEKSAEAVKIAVSLVLPYPPSANRNWRYSQHGGPSLAPEVKAFRDAVGYECLRQRIARAPEGAEITLAATFYRPQRSGDLDNRLKTLIDALRGHVYPDDSQIVRIVADREDDPENPRAEVSVSWLAAPDLPVIKFRGPRKIGIEEARKMIAADARRRGGRR